MNTTKQLHSFDQAQTLEMHAKLPKLEKSGDYLEDDHGYEADEDILSLCDLQVSCKNNQNSHHGQKIVLNKSESHEISSSPLNSSSSPRGENQDNLFEFFSEEWNIVDTTTSPTLTISKPVVPFPPPQAATDEDLVFRQKIVSNSKPPNPRTKNPVVPRITHPRHKIRSNSTRMAASKSTQPIITKSKSYSSGTSKLVEDQSKVSAASPAKSKLFLVLFGLPPKIQTSQTMNDIKIRQSRHAPSTFFPSNSGGGCRDDQDAVTPGRRSENRMWRFIKAVTCFRSQHREKMSFDV